MRRLRFLGETEEKIKNVVQKLFEGWLWTATMGDIRKFKIKWNKSINRTGEKAAWKIILGFKGRI